jgi:hypothetical protein
MLALLPVLALFSYGALGVPTDLIVRDASTDLVARSVVDDFNNFISSVSDKINVNEIKQGILPDFFSNIPDEQGIKDQLGLNDTQIDELPLEVLNIPFVNPHPLLFLHFKLTTYPVATQTTQAAAGTCVFMDRHTSSLSPQELQSQMRLLIRQQMFSFRI